MDAKQKAKELVEEFIPPTRVQDIEENWVDDLYYAKQCALRAVDLAIEEINLFGYGNPILVDKRLHYYQEVKQEIEKL
jgi:hypothetical protein